MHPESFSRNLSYKLRELELVIRQLESDADPARIDIDLALEKTRELYNILLQINAGRYDEPFGKKHPHPHGKTVVPSDPEPVEREKVFQAEGVIPDPSYRQTEKAPPLPEKPVHQQKEKQEAQPETEKKRTAGEKPGKEVGPRQDAAADLKAGEKEEAEGEEDNKKTKNSDKDHQIEIVADRYQSSQSYLNQAMATRQASRDIASIQRLKPITDLRNSIGLNEKFLFIKELFKGRPEKYNQCIDNLNQSASYEDAVKYIRETYSWEEDNEIVSKLLALLKRKHQSE